MCGAGRNTGRHDTGAPRPGVASSETDSMITLLAAASVALAAAPPEPSKPPRLGVFIVIDQLGASELEALALDGETDFGGLEARGAARFEALYPYVGTETGPGHATLSTS